MKDSKQRIATPPLETISLCSPGWTRTCYVNQIGFELTGIRLSLPPDCSD